MTTTERPGPVNVFPPVDRGLENAVMALAQQIANLADAMNHVAVASQALRTPPGAAKPPASAGGAPPPPTGPPGGSGGSKTVEQKMAGKVFAICAQNEWNIAEIGQRVTGRPMNADSRTWTKADLAGVLDAMKDWGFA